MASQTETTNPEADRPVILIVEDEALTIMDLGDVLEGAATTPCNAPPPSARCPSFKRGPTSAAS